MKNKSYIIIIAVLLIGSLIIGCSKEQPQRTTDQLPINDKTSDEDCTLAPDITGEVLEISNDSVLRVLVDSTSDTINGQIWVTINEETTFIDQKGNKIEPDDIESLFVVGQSALLTSNGNIMESYPMQTGAVYVYLN